MSKDQSNYLVQPDYCAERKADYKAGEKMNAKFKMVSRKEVHKNQSDGLNGNVSSYVTVSRETRKVTIHKEYPDTIKKKAQVALYEAISSALALYRIICMFKNPQISLEGADGYKCPWFAYFKHEKTGAYIALGEWKGAFGLWTSFNSPEEFNGELKEDTIALLNLIMSDKSPHPYDRTTAGSVA